MKCSRCGSDVNDKWIFCPRCGSKLGSDIFSNAFKRVGREMKEIDRKFEKNFEVLDLSPFFRKPTRSGGFSIRISRSGAERPKVSVKTFGDFNRKQLESKMGKLGLKEIPRPQEPEKKGVQLEKTRTTEEPETSVKNVGDRIVVEVKLPGVRGSEDIEIKSLENSIEIKAIAGDKAYFKILTKPPKANIIGKDFDNGILRIELV